MMTARKNSQQTKYTIAKAEIPAVVFD